ncbi:MAG: hypothetical protein JWM76_212, partial [Pseudonocardiales bacterium]|nr:hypothetical protein [Pseudonocardiales bacterium]
MTGPNGGRLALLDRLHLFVDELRARGLPVSMVERIDAAHALEGTALDNTYGLHTALSATLVKSHDHLRVFDEVFQIYFRLPGDTSGLGAQAASNPFGPLVPDEVDSRHLIDLDHALRGVLSEDSDALARLVAEQAVRQFTRFESGRSVAGVMYESQAVAGLRLDQIVAEIQRELAAQMEAEGRGSGSGRGGGSGSGGGSGQGGGIGSGFGGDPMSLGLEIDLRRVQDRADALRARIREVIREMLVADRGLEAVAKTLRTPLPTDVDLSRASRAQLEEIEQVMVPLQRKLATTMMRKRRQRTGVIDVRATLRFSMATGGVPVRVIHRRPTPTKPKL